MKVIYLFAFLLMITGCKDADQITEATAMADQTREDQQEKTFKVSMSDQEWKEVLTEDEFYILRKAGTERPFSSDLLGIKEPGTFICAGCNNPLYETEHKFKSGTGWPSFDRAIDGALAYDSDRKLGYKRDELLCGTCGGHLGHVFDDGPRETTGKRHCINGDALDFIPKGKKLPKILNEQ